MYIEGKCCRKTPKLTDYSGISSFRTQTMDFQLDVYFQQYWRDPRLSHNETSRVLIRDSEILRKLWRPDVYFANARTGVSTFAPRYLL
jgi:hypothetical protein